MKSGTNNHLKKNNIINVLCEQLFLILNKLFKPNNEWIKIKIGT